MLEVNYLLLQFSSTAGHVSARALWKDYLLDANALVFMLDSNDRSRFQEARDELWHLYGNPAFKDTPICVLCNKQDIPGAASRDECIIALGLTGVALGGKGENMIQVFDCSVSQGTGYQAAFKWIASLLP